MTHSRSYTSATHSSSGDASSNLRRATDHLQANQGQATSSMRYWWAESAILLLGFALRLLRLSWQPIWWDEGYSIYFATEPLPTMLWLTAHDIHPPLYYALLHLWLNATGSTTPESARIFSALIGTASLPIMTWAAMTLWPQQRRLVLLSTLLLAVNPLHIFYSQEIRMYGLALLLSLAAATFFWKVDQALLQGKRPTGAFIGYVCTASLALLTLYYTGLLLLALHLWALVNHRTHWRRQGWFMAAALLILLIQLPWWLYAVPKLIPYVADKVRADQDTSLPLWLYLWRHWLAYLTGHLVAQPSWLDVVRNMLAALAAVLLAGGTWFASRKREKAVIGWLLCLLLIPTLTGFLVNLVYPFFPEGGERLLLHLLPYVLLLFAFVITRLSSLHKQLAVALLIVPIAAALLGTLTFFTTPRYAGEDYRPIITSIFTHSRPNDTVLALFPWQVGYWRAYSPRGEDGNFLPPQPAPVDQTVLRWNDNFAARLDHALAAGTIWFPMPLSFGSTLPQEIEEYLKPRARNLENQWFPPSTRLTAWVQLEGEDLLPIHAVFDEQLTLVSGSISPTTVPSANTPLAVDLCWEPPLQRDDLRATLRLVDQGDFVWAKRDLTPFAAFATNEQVPCQESLAINIPVGVPPATYELVLGVGPKDSDQLFVPTSASSPLVPLGQITVTAPREAISPHRLPIQYRLASPLTDSGLLLLGYSGPGRNASLLAGDTVAVTLFLQNSAAKAPVRELYISLLDQQGNGLAGWQGWPLPDYPTDQWPKDTLTQVPVTFYLPPDLAEGRYRLVAGFADTAANTKSAPAALGSVQIIRRASTLTPPPNQTPVTPPATIGTHAILTAYDVTLEDTSLHLNLTWQIIQPLLPPHHIFVHLLDATGERIAQSDGEPVTTAGRAPTGSWLPGEYLTTQHTLSLPENATAPFTIQVGLYLEATGQRLPVTVENETIGDSAEILLPLAP